MIVSPVEPSDLGAIGLLIAESAMSALSSPHDEREMIQEGLHLAHMHVGSRVEVGDIALKVERGDQLAAFGVIRPRVLVRSSHVGEAQLLVHPHARRHGIGLLLIEHLTLAACSTSALRKLSMRVNEEDSALISLLRAQTGWARERVELGALTIGDRDVAVEVWGIELP